MNLHDVGNLIDFLSVRKYLPSLDEEHGSINPGWWSSSLPPLVSHRRRPSMVAAEYGTPPAIAGHDSAGVGLYGPRSALGRPLTANTGARDRRLGDR
jgi:hypothetical protein